MAKAEYQRIQRTAVSRAGDKAGWSQTRSFKAAARIWDFIEPKSREMNSYLF